VGLLALAGSLHLAHAATFVCGNVSGTWTKANSPYVVTCSLIVPTGQTLTIQPGVEVIMGQGLKMDVQGGRILANGTAAERITFRGANSSLYWDKISLNYISAGDSSFVSCNFTEATNALRFVCQPGFALLSPQVIDCVFSNCINTCIYGEGYVSGTFAGIILNCRFQASSNGVHLVNGGLGSSGPMNAIVANNYFQSLSGSAMRFEVYQGASNPKFVNNIVAQCSTGIRKTGSSATFNDEVAYNCLFNNQTNFVGYPAGVHGTICCVNNNGTPCDIVYNIFQNPLFCETSNYTLSSSSPCIDAGNPGGAYLDSCFAAGACQPGSLGTAVNDIGVWGGPSVCDRINPPATTFTVAAQKFVGVTIYPSTPGHYRMEYTPTLGSTNIWTQITNVNLLSTPWTYIDFDYPNVGKRFYRAVLLP
jgi:hypothetical protein